MQNGTHKNGNGSSNGVHKDIATLNGHDPVSSAAHELLWDGLPPAVTGALGQPLDPALVSRREGRTGRIYDYLEGHTVIDQANRIFGYGGWGYELAGDVTLRQFKTVDAETGEVKDTHAYSAPVRVTVPGAPPRTDVGFQWVAEETPDDHETACKGAVTDGLKRALRSFGDRFGNGLYGDRPTAGGSPRPQRVRAQAKGRSGGGAGNRDDETRVRKLRKRLVELGVEQGFDEEQVRAAVKRQTRRDLDELPASELMPLVESATQKLHQVREARAA